jgi:hypothetical protein
MVKALFCCPNNKPRGPDGGIPSIAKQPRNGVKGHFAHIHSPGESLDIEVHHVVEVLGQARHHGADIGTVLLEEGPGRFSIDLFRRRPFS